MEEENEEQGQVGDEERIESVGRSRSRYRPVRAYTVCMSGKMTYLTPSECNELNSPYITFYLHGKYTGMI